MEEKDPGGEAVTEERKCICPYCDNSLIMPYPFCQVCGKELRFCPQCGQPLARDAVICGQCGTELG